MKLKNLYILTVILLSYLLGALTVLITEGVILGG